MADYIQLRTTTLNKGEGWLESYGRNLVANDIMLARMRYTASDPMLEQVDCEPGATWMHAGSGLLRSFRIDGTATADETTRLKLSTPYRGTWHYDDNTGTPALDGRVKKGDAYIEDSGSGDRVVKYYDSVAGAFKGFGVLAEYRTAATATNGTTQNQASGRITMRSSRWDTSGTPAAQDREWSMYCHTSASAGDGYSLLHIDRRHNGGSWTGVATLDTNGWLYLAGAVPGVELNSGGAGSAFLRLYSSDPDGSLLKFGHGNGSRWGRLRAYGTTTGGTGLDADVLGVSYGSAATALATLRNSPSLAWYASAWDGGAAVELGAYEQLIPTSSTAAYLRRGFGSFGSGTLDLYSDGGLRVTQDPAGSSVAAGQIQANTSVAATALAKTSPGGAFSSVGYSWDGAASQPRVMGWYTSVDDPADATDAWSHRLIAVGGGSPTEVLFATSAGWLGIGAAPAVAGHITETTTITGGVTDGYTASLRLQPTYTAASAQTVTRHNYLDVKNVTLAGAGPAALTDACFARFDAAAGTHKAVDASSTKTTPGGVDAWVKVNINGTIHYMPAYLSKTA